MTKATQRYAGRLRRGPIAFVLVAALAAPASAQAGAGDIIVRRDAGLDRAERLALRERAGVRFAAALPLSGAELVTPAGSAEAALDALKRDPHVVYAEPDRRMHALTNDADWGEQWNLENAGQDVYSRGSGWTAGVEDADIDAPDAWLRSRGAGVTVAVVDSGVDAAQPDLQGQIATELGYDWVDGGEPQDEDGHGTHVAGTIAAVADNGIGIAGVAPAAKLAVLRVLDGYGEGYSSDIAAAFAYAGANGLPIVNASLGGSYTNVVAQAIASYPKTLFVVAAGNNGVDTSADAEAFPCKLPYANVVCVGASDNQDEPAAFSDFSPVSVDLFAPGVAIPSTLPNDSFGSMSGTSMAAPHVSGTAALALAANPALSTAQLRSALLDPVDHPAALSGYSATGGRLNADTSVQAATAMTPQPTPSPTPTPAPTPPPPPPPPEPPAAALTSLTLSGHLRTSRSKLRVKFSITAAASVRFTVTKRGAKKALSTWTSRARKGANVVTLTRQLPTHRTLSRGTYTLSLRASDSARSVRFSVR